MVAGERNTSIVKTDAEIGVPQTRRVCHAASYDPILAFRLSDPITNRDHPSSSPYAPTIGFLVQYALAISYLSVEQLQSIAMEIPSARETQQFRRVNSGRSCRDDMRFAAKTGCDS